MTKELSFRQIENYSSIVEENEFFIQYTNPEVPDRYDSNYVLLKFSPTLEEFQIIETIHLEHQRSQHQSHVHFKWPENVGLYPDVLEYFNQQDYKIGMQNLYWVTPNDFRVKQINPNSQIEQVNEDTFNDFMTINLAEDLTHGKDFYEHKKRFYPYQYQTEHTNFILAYLDDQPVGSLILNHSECFLEVDNVLTVQNYRMKKVASTLLDTVVHQMTHKNQKVILVADAEDTPKNMYESMGFKSAGYQISAQKLL